jgi:hypothetical protein
MKKITVIILVVLIAVLLSAFTPVPNPVPPPIQHLSGTLGYGHNSVCMIQDFVSLPVMDNIYLRGNGFPTIGQYRGCRIEAAGTYVSIDTCKVFQVSSARIFCQQDLPVTFPTLTSALPTLSNH